MEKGISENKFIKKVEIEEFYGIISSGVYEK